MIEGFDEACRSLLRLLFLRSASRARARARASPAFDPAPALPHPLPRARAPCVRPGHPHPSSPRPRPITLDPRPRPIPLGSRFALDSAGSAFEPAARVCLAVQFSCVARLVGAVRIPVSRDVSRETSVRVGEGAQDGTRAGERPATDRFPAHGRECPPYARFFSLAISSDLVFPSSPPSAGPDNRA